MLTQMLITFLTTMIALHASASRVRVVASCAAVRRADEGSDPRISTQTTRIRVRPRSIC
jgi:hypothetical protein